MAEDEVRIVSTTGSFGRFVVTRLRPGTDLVAGIVQACEEHEMASAVVVSCVGALRRATILLPEVDTGRSGGLYFRYGEPMRLSGPLALLGASGVFSYNGSGESFLHLHGSVAGKELGVAHGGHFVPGENPVQQMEAVIAELAGAGLIRRRDAELGTELLLGLGE